MNHTEPKRRRLRKQRPPDPDPWLSPADIQDYMRIARGAVWNLLKLGRETKGQDGIWPQYHPTPKVTLVRRSSVDRYVERRRHDLIYET